MSSEGSNGFSATSTTPGCWKRPTLPEGLGALTSLLSSGGVTVLSGAGISTESGIPDYRGPTGLARSSPPMTYQDFTGSFQARQRYWARSHLGWRFITRAIPNQGHRAVSDLQHRGFIDDVITQNVDGLHQAAGARGVIDLHGRLDRVVCLDCHDLTSRDALDDRLRAANRDWDAHVTALNPDGDAVISPSDIERFVIANCAACDGRLKPDVVFFGENVPKPRVDDSYEMVASSRSLLVLGSSLTVASGYRFVRHAAKLGRPIAIVNQGATRGDPVADVLVDAPLGETLHAIADALLAPLGTVPAGSSGSAS